MGGIKKKISNYLILKYFCSGIGALIGLEPTTPSLRMMWVLCRHRHKTHWTKHKSRLDREFGRKKWGDEGYAREELVAELGAAFLCADLELTPEVRSDHAAYIQSWLKVLKEDKRAIFAAAAHAQRAADFLHGCQPAVEEEKQQEAAA